MPDIEHHESDDGSLDDIFSFLVLRISGSVLDEVGVTRTEMMNLFDAFVVNTAETLETKDSAEIGRMLFKMINKFSKAELLDHLRDVRKHLKRKDEQDGESPES